MNTKTIMTIVSISVVLIVITAPVKMFDIVVPTLAQKGPVIATKPSTSVSNCPNTADFSLKYNVKFSPADTQKQHQPLWNLTEWIQATPEHLLQIKDVVYHVTIVPSGARGNLQPITTQKGGNSFSYSFLVFGSFPLTATLHFKDGKSICLGPRYFTAVIPP